MDANAKFETNVSMDINKLTDGKPEKMFAASLTWFGDYESAVTVERHMVNGFLPGMLSEGEKKVHPSG